MKTVTELLCEMGDEIKVAAVDLLHNYSGIEHRPVPIDPIPSNHVVVRGPNHNWRRLSESGQQLQSRVRSQHEKLHAILCTLLKSQARPTKGALIGHARAAERVINQEGVTSLNTINEAALQFQKAIDGQIALLANLYDGAEGRHIYVPDTNALLHNPNLEDWEFDVSPKFTLILIPTVLSELDQLKVNHRNDVVRQKAEGLIRRIKGYRSRGRLAEGVPLRTNRSTLATVAVEPNIAESLPWLKADNNDDRLLAGFIEVMRAHPRCPVVLVTRDVKLQNKAEYAGLPFVEPPEPPVAPSTP